MEPIEGDDFNQVATKPLPSMPCGVPGQAFVAFEKPEGSCSLGKFSNTLRFYVKEVRTSVYLVKSRGRIVQIVVILVQNDIYKSKHKV